MYVCDLPYICLTLRDTCNQAVAKSDTKHLFSIFFKNFSIHPTKLTCGNAWRLTDVLDIKSRKLSNTQHSFIFNCISHVVRCFIEFQVRPLSHANILKLHIVATESVFHTFEPLASGILLAYLFYLAFISKGSLAQTAA